MQGALTLTLTLTLSLTRTLTLTLKASSKPEAAVKGDERYGEDDPRYALVKEEVQPSAEVTEKQARHQADVDAITASNAAAMEEAAAKHQKVS